MKAMATRILFLALVVCLPMEGLTSTDSKITPGIMCQPINGDNIGYYEWSSGLDDNRGEVTTESATRRVACAIIHDVVTSGLTDLEVNVRPASGTTTLCQAWAASRYGGSRSWSQWLETDGSSPQALDFNEVGGFDRGTFWVECDIPPGAEVVSIDAEELVQ